MHESQTGSKWRRWIIPADLNDNRALEIRRLSVVPRFRLFSRCTFYSRTNFPSRLGDRYDVTSRSVRSWTRATYGERKWPLDHLNATGFARTYLRKFASVLRIDEECWRGDLGLTRHMKEMQRLSSSSLSVAIEKFRKRELRCWKFTKWKMKKSIGRRKNRRTKECKETKETIQTLWEIKKNKK